MGRQDLMQIGKYEFRHRWSLTVTLLILLPLGLSLGFWQIDRGREKQVEVDLRNANTASVATILQSGDTDKTDMLYRQVEIHGVFDLEQQILLENQKHNGAPGYHVFTPMQIQGSNTYVLVSRGWIRQGNDRRFISALPGPEDSVNIQGRVENVPSVGIKLGLPGESGRLWPKRVIYIDLDWIAKETGYNLLPYVVYQTGGKEYGLVRDWRQKFQSGPVMPPEKHFVYAIQWFSLAGLALIMYVILSLKKSRGSSGSGVKRSE
jgi:surfeit locus 1 family protein